MAGTGRSARMGRAKGRSGGRPMVAPGGAICCGGGMTALPPLPTDPRPGLYRHYKGNDYRVVGLARHSETQEVLVIYQALYGERGMWLRPQPMFVETVEVGGAQVPRFAYVGEAGSRSNQA